RGRFVGPVKPRNGIVTVNGIPVSGLEKIAPSNGGSPATLLIIPTAPAPAGSPKIAFATRPQTPRLTTPGLPATGTPSHVKSETLQPSDSSAGNGVAGLSVITLTV